MSEREKRLLIVVAVLVFGLINVGAYKLYYLPQKEEAQKSKEEFTSNRQTAMEMLKIQDSQRAEMDWLERSEQKVIKSSQQALTDLEALANREAQRRGLTVKRVKPLPALEAPELEFHRARVEIEVSGREQVLFQWIDRLNTPSDLRAATTLSINPKKDDDTQVDCRVTLEQWFLPKERWESENFTEEG
ncbi:MAG TPA: hypothetical protein DCQ96_00345 [Verrucomicrobiales bacterium]|nr:hypothetical protein [Verrucomicrobiales bacterium]